MSGNRGHPGAGDQITEESLVACGREGSSAVSARRGNASDRRVARPSSRTTRRPTRTLWARHLLHDGDRAEARKGSGQLPVLVESFHSAPNVAVGLREEAGRRHRRVHRRSQRHHAVRRPRGAPPLGDPLSRTGSQTSRLASSTGAGDLVAEGPHTKLLQVAPGITIEVSVDVPWAQAGFLGMDHASAPVAIQVPDITPFLAISGATGDTSLGDAGVNVSVGDDLVSADCTKPKMTQTDSSEMVSDKQKPDMTKDEPHLSLGGDGPKVSDVIGSLITALMKVNVSSDGDALLRNCLRPECYVAMPQYTSEPFDPSSPSATAPSQTRSDASTSVSPPPPMPRTPSTPLPTGFPAQMTPPHGYPFPGPSTYPHSLPMPPYSVYGPHPAPHNFWSAHNPQGWVMGCPPAPHSHRRKQQKGAAKSDGTSTDKDTSSKSSKVTQDVGAMSFGYPQVYPGFPEQSNFAPDGNKMEFHELPPGISVSYSSDPSKWQTNSPPNTLHPGLQGGVMNITSSFGPVPPPTGYPPCAIFSQGVGPIPTGYNPMPFPPLQQPCPYHWDQVPGVGYGWTTAGFFPPPPCALLSQDEMKTSSDSERVAAQVNRDSERPKRGRRRSSRGRSCSSCSRSHPPSPPPPPPPPPPHPSLDRKQKPPRSVRTSASVSKLSKMNEWSSNTVSQSPTEQPSLRKWREVRRRRFSSSSELRLRVNSREVRNRSPSSGRDRKPSVKKNSSSTGKTPLPPELASAWARMGQSSTLEETSSTSGKHSEGKEKPEAEGSSQEAATVGGGEQPSPLQTPSAEPRIPTKRDFRTQSDACASDDSRNYRDNEDNSAWENKYFGKRRKLQDECTTKRTGKKRFNADFKLTEFRFLERDLYAAWHQTIPEQEESEQDEVETADACLGCDTCSTSTSEEDEKSEQNSEDEEEDGSSSSLSTSSVYEDEEIMRFSSLRRDTMALAPLRKGTSKDTLPKEKPPTENDEVQEKKDLQRERDLHLSFRGFSDSEMDTKVLIGWGKDSVSKQPSYTSTNSVRGSLLEDSFTPSSSLPNMKLKQEESTLTQSQETMEYIRSSVFGGILDDIEGGMVKIQRDGSRVELALYTSDSDVQSRKISFGSSKVKEFRSSGASEGEEESEVESLEEFGTYVHPYSDGEEESEEFGETRESSRGPMMRPPRVPRPPQPRSRAPRSKSRAPRSKSRAPQQRSRAPQQRSRVPQQRSPAPRSKSRAPRSRSRAPRSRSRAPRSRDRAPGKFRGKRDERKIEDGKKKPCDTCNKKKTLQKKRKLQMLRLAYRSKKGGMCVVDPLHISMQHHGRRGAIPYRGLGPPRFRYLYHNWVCPCCRRDMCWEELGFFDPPPFKAQRLPGWLRARIAWRALELRKRADEEKEFRSGEEFIEDPYGPYYNYYYDSCDQTKNIPCHISKPYPQSGPCVHSRNFKTREMCSCAVDTSGLSDITESEKETYRLVMKKLKQRYTGKSLFKRKNQLCKKHASCKTLPVSYESAMSPCPLVAAADAKAHAADKVKQTPKPPAGKISTLIPAPYDGIQRTTWALPYPFRFPDPCYNAVKGMLCPYCHRRSHDTVALPPADQPPEIQVAMATKNSVKAPATVSIRTMGTARHCHRCCCICRSHFVPKTWKP